MAKLTAEQTEKLIAKNMKALDLTREEAIQLMVDDGVIDKMSVGQAESDLSPEQKAQAKKARQADREKGVYKFTKRERKPNPTKEGIISEIFTFLTENSSFDCENVEIVNKQGEIAFKVGEKSYSVKLTEHRAPKT